MAAWIRCLLWLGASVLLQSYSFGQQYPTKPIRFISPFAPGGTADILARLVGQKLGEQLGQSVVVDNRGGAGGNIGTALGAKAPPDGYTIILGVVSPLAINVSLYGSRLPYDPIKDFEPISLITKVPQVLALHSSVPARNIRELIALAKSHPNKLTFGSAGSGTSGHLSGELLKTAAGIRIVHVPYKSAGAAMIAILSGEVDMMISAPPPMLPYLKSGRLRAIAVSSAERSPLLPAVPTMIESGLSGFDATAWYCLVAPAGTASPIVDKLRGALIKAMETPQLRERMFAEGAAPESSTPEELRDFIRSEIVKWQTAVKVSGAKID